MNELEKAEERLRKSEKQFWTVAVVVGVLALVLMTANMIVQGHEEHRYYADNSEHYFTDPEDYEAYRAERDTYLMEVEQEAAAITVSAEEVERERQAEVERLHKEALEEIQDADEEDYYDDLELLACIVEAEAGNQEFIGKCLVADVVFNRVDHEDFPDTIYEVIEQPGQFAAYKKALQTTPSEETYEAVAREAEGKRLQEDILYFNNSGYHSCGTPWEKVGDHYFSKE